MNQKTRVLHVRVVGFSAPEKQMLNSIFLLSVAPARQIGYKLWNADSGTAPDMYLLDGDSEAAVLSWQAAFSNTADRTLVVGSRNIDLGVASASRPLGLKVVGAMDRLAIAINNVADKLANSGGLDVSQPRMGSGTLPTSAAGTMPTTPLVSAAVSAPLAPPVVTAPVPVAAAPAAAAPAAVAPAPVVAAASPPAPVIATPMNASLSAGAPHAGTMPAMTATMTANAPATTVLPSMTLQPNVPLAERALERSINEKPAAEKPALERAEKTIAEKAVDKILTEKPAALSPTAASLMSSGVTPLSPAALSAVVSTSATRTNLRVVSNGSPLAASLPGAASVAAQARIAEVPMAPPVPMTARMVEVPVTPVVVAAPAPAVAPVVAPAAPVAPVVITPVAVAPPPAPTAPVMQNSSPTPRHEEQVFRVLAVDDSPLMRTFLQNKLQPYGIAPEFAASGEEALFKISKQHFDMIFLDVMLPGMDGYDVCKMIKKNKDNNLMKVVMLTSKDKTFDKIRGTMAGCDGYLTKPVDEMKLRAIIERHTVVRK